MASGGRGLITGVRSLVLAGWVSKNCYLTYAKTTHIVLLKAGFSMIYRSAVAARTIVASFLLAAVALPCCAQGSFEQVPGSLSQISVGADGTVWGIDSSQNIFTWDPSSGQFVQIPGQLKQIAVGNANAVWGLNAQGYIYRWDSRMRNWTSIPGNLQQIAVGGDGDVWG